jgi:hypothetical protein
MTTELIVSAFVGLFVALIGAAIVAVGWRVTHRYEMERVRAAKRRELKVHYLIDAFRQLEYVSNRPIGPETAPDFEKAIADIQLFGTASQVELAQQCAAGMAQNGTHPLDDLLADLRQSLREELDLERVPDKIKYLRFSFPPAPESAAKDFVRGDGKRAGLTSG